MKINNGLPFLLRDIYLYDIKECHYTILTSLGFDLSNIPRDNKLERNKQIGIMMRDNPRLVYILRNITNATIDEYILRNKIKEEEIILKQYDGIITTKRLVETTTKYIPLPLRSTFQYFLSSIDRGSYVAYDGINIKIKGVSYRYKEMDLMINKLMKINLADKIETFKSLQRIKDEIIYSTNPKLFCIPSGNKICIFLKTYGQVEISPSLASVMDVNDIDRNKYFEFYLAPFTKALTYELIK